MLEGDHFNILLIRYESAQSYRDIFYPLVVLEAEDEEKAEKAKVIRTH